jgi:hypothetical protein
MPNFVLRNNRTFPCSHKAQKLKAAIRVAVTFATIELHVCNCKDHMCRLSILPGIQVSSYSITKDL